MESVLQIVVIRCKIKYLLSGVHLVTVVCQQLLTNVCCRGCLAWFSQTQSNNNNSLLHGCLSNWSAEYLLLFNFSVRQLLPNCLCIANLNHATAKERIGKRCAFICMLCFKRKFVLAPFSLLSDSNLLISLGSVGVGTYCHRGRRKKSLQENGFKISPR